MYDYIIVGQGIAGSVLSYTLLQKGKKILVVDKGNLDSSSAVAAGLFNPIIGKKMVKTWEAEKLFPFLLGFYKSLQEELKEEIFFEKSVYKPFPSIEDQNFWVSNNASGDSDFVEGTVLKEKYVGLVDNEYGGFETKASGFVDVKKMLLAVKEYLKKNAVYRDDVVKLEELTMHEDKVSWKGVEAKKIIFCEGYHAIENPFFKWLPFNPVKGETITVKIKNFNVDSILNRKVFMIPLSEDTYKVGATFDWILDTDITEQAKEELSAKLKTLIKVPFEIIDQEAGIRPAVHDRRPLIGLHPEYLSVAIFNGLGTKGISLAPYFAEQFYNFLENAGELDPTTNIKRFYPLYYDSKG